MSDLICSLSVENEILISVFDEGIEPREVIKVTPTLAQTIVTELASLDETIPVQLSASVTETISRENASQLRWALGELIKRFE